MLSHRQISTLELISSDRNIFWLLFGHSLTIHLCLGKNSWEFLSIMIRIIKEKNSENLQASEECQHYHISSFRRHLPLQSGIKESRWRLTAINRSKIRFILVSTNCLSYQVLCYKICFQWYIVKLKENLSSWKHGLWSNLEGLCLVRPYFVHLTLWHIFP